MSNIIPLFSKKTEDGREPLFVSHVDGTVKGSPHFKRSEAEDFADRMQRIRISLEKINKLMSELKGQQAYDKDKGTT